MNAFYEKQLLDDVNRRLFVPAAAERVVLRKIAFSALQGDGLLIYKRLLFVLGKIVLNGALCDVLHYGGHFLDSPTLIAKIKTAAIESTRFIVVKVCSIEVAEHSHRRYAVQDG